MFNVQYHQAPYCLPDCITKGAVIKFIFHKYVLPLAERASFFLYCECVIMPFNLKNLSKDTAFIQPLRRKYKTTSKSDHYLKKSSSFYLSIYHSCFIARMLTLLQSKSNQSQDNFRLVFKSCLCFFFFFSLCCKYTNPHQFTQDKWT